MLSKKIRDKGKAIKQYEKVKETDKCRKMRYKVRFNGQ